jgi:hypothetical protein
MPGGPRHTYICPIEQHKSISRPISEQKKAIDALPVPSTPPPLDCDVCVAHRCRLVIQFLRATMKSFDLSQLGLSRFISSDIILLMLPTKCYSLYQPKHVEMSPAIRRCRSAACPCAVAQNRPPDQGDAQLRTKQLVAASHSGLLPPIQPFI